MSAETVTTDTALNHAAEQGLRAEALDSQLATALRRLAEAGNDRDQARRDAARAGFFLERWRQRARDAELRLAAARTVLTVLRRLHQPHATHDGTDVCVACSAALLPCGHEPDGTAIWTTAASGTLVAYPCDVAQAIDGLGLPTGQPDDSIDDGEEQAAGTVDTVRADLRQAALSGRGISLDPDGAAMLWRSFVVLEGDVRAEMRAAGEACDCPSLGHIRGRCRRAEVSGG